MTIKRYSITPCVYGGNRVWIEQARNDPPMNQPIKSTMNALSKWDGADKISDKYICWEVDADCVPAIRKFLNRNNLMEDENPMPEWLQ